MLGSSATNYFETEDGFLFPFKPYDVQHRFMQNLYDVLENKRHGIFESPTGTGKSLSIICGAIKWLKSERSRKKQELQSILDNNSKFEDDADWFTNYTAVMQVNETRKNAKEELDFIKSYEKKIDDIRLLSKTELLNENNKKSFFVHPPSKKQKINAQSFDTALCEDEEEEEDDDDDSKSDEVKKDIKKIFYASRTHSQLLQFMNELKKSPYSNNVTVTILGARSNLCINESVKKLKKHSLINERCTELLKNKASKKSSACPFYVKKNMKKLQNIILREVVDIEDLGKYGEELKACPYYSARKITCDTEMIILPYNILLHKPTRDSYGISLKDNVVIIDEAHNLLDAISNMYSADITCECLHETLEQLKQYKFKYGTRFSPMTLLRIKQLIVLVQSFINFFSKFCKNESQGNANSMTDNVKVMSCLELIAATGIQEINVFDLIQFCDESYIGNKLMGFASTQPCVSESITQSSKGNGTNSVPAKSTLTSFLDEIKNKKITKQPKLVHQKNEFVKPGNASSFFVFLQFLKTFTLPCAAGRYMLKKDSEGFVVKFLHLNSSLHFKDIVYEAQSVVLAGGTMEPISDFLDQLFSQTSSKLNISFHSYSHVVSEENIVVLPVSSGFQNIILDFTYKSRTNQEVLGELSRILLSLAAEVPGGLVIFFPSYSYEQYFFNYLSNNGLLNQFSQKKTVFREPKEASAVEGVLEDYANATKRKKPGAVLFCVVNGKMSEGINFSDDLCRCVVMVGMPYPNKNSPELQEKLKYLRECYSLKQEAEYCSNLCIKAVNQSIGRAIRHKNDYASIVLLDYRYCEPSVQSKLPTWLKSRISGNVRFSAAFAELKVFFSDMKKKIS